MLGKGCPGCLVVLAALQLDGLVARDSFHHLQTPFCFPLGIDSLLSFPSTVVILDASQVGYKPAESWLTLCQLCELHRAQQ